LEILRGRGVLKAKMLEAKYGTKLEFSGARSDAKQKPSMGGVWIFSGALQDTFCCSVTENIQSHSFV